MFVCIILYYYLCTVIITKAIMKFVTLSMTVNGYTFSQPEASVFAALKRVSTVSRLSGCQVGNVTIKCEKL